MDGDGRDGDGASVELHGRAELVFVDRALEQIESLWDCHRDVATDDRTLFTLAVSEVLTNIVQHGVATEEAPVTRISLRVDVEEGELRAIVRDSAAPVSIDWQSVTMPDAQEESGRGLAMARSALHELEHSAGDVGNTWTMRRRRAPRQPGG